MSEAGLKTLILTGASRGIGHATVKRFSQEGWRIITCSREDVPDECRRDPNWNRHITVDLADPRAVETFVAEANAALAGAPLHALVNNAAVSPKTAFKERLGILNGALDAWRGVFELNFFAPLALARGFAPGPSSWPGDDRQHHLHRRPRHPPLRRLGLQHLEGGALGADPRNGGGIRRSGRPGQCGGAGRDRDRDGRPRI